MQPKYANSVVYKIVCLDPTITDLYVGSTTNLIRRKCEHKTRCNSPNNPKSNYLVYQCIRQNGGFDNWQFIVIRRYNNIKTKEELLRKERKHMVKLKATLNKNLAGQWLTLGEKEYYKQYSKKYVELHRDERKKYKQNYYEQNKDKINEREREYRNGKGSIQCECGCMITKFHLKRHQATKKHIQLMEDK